VNVNALGDAKLERLEHLIAAGDALPSHRRVELVVAWHMNEYGLAWPSLERVAVMLRARWAPNMNGPARGPGSTGTSRRTVRRVLAASRFYLTAGRVADHHRQHGGGWFTHGAVRALTDETREEIGLAVGVAEALEWATREGVTAPLDRLPSRGYDPEFGR
jgi:hypothetical protein